MGPVRAGDLAAAAKAIGPVEWLGARRSPGLSEALTWAFVIVELRGIEPLTPSMPWKCSTN